jgi:hypothetical protein
VKRPLPWIAVAAFAAAIAVVGLRRTRSTAIEEPVAEPSAPAVSATPSPVGAGVAAITQIAAPRPTPAPSAAGSPTAAASRDAELEARFAALAERTLRELPTAADMRALTPEQMHGYPPPIARAGRALGRVAQEVHDHPELAESAARFYRSCALSPAVVDPIRAMCYFHVMDTPDAPPAGSVPAEVARLARLLPPGS